MKEFPPYRQLLDAEHATTDLVTGVIKLRETYEYWLACRSNNETTTQRSKHLEAAIAHEIVHVIQSITTSKILNLAEDYRFLFSQLVKYRLSGIPWNELLPEARRSYQNIKSGFETMTESGISESHGSMAVSVEQMFEDMAIIETIRSTYISESDQLLNSMELTPFDARYGRCLGILMRKIGPAGAIKFASTIYFFCLNCEDSPKAFGAIVNWLYELPYSFIQSLGCGEFLELLFEQFKVDWSGSPIAQFARQERVSKATMWNDIGVAFATSGPTEVVLRVAANPSSLLAESNWSKVLDQTTLAKVTPPLTIWSDGVAILNKSLPEQTARTLLNVMAISGAILRLVDPVEPFVACRVTGCPVRASGLCHNHVPPPSDTVWNECSFISTASQLFECEASELSETVKALWKNQ